jgi:6-phosphogluconolactonase (cycloisomerase 2 family)
VVALAVAAGTLAAAGEPGMVYTATNGAAGNEILRYARGADGSLAPADSTATGGLGTGTGLGNQGGLRLTADGKFLLAVNAASHDVSVLRVTHEGLELCDRESSGGQRPISIAVSGRLVYVLNAGGLLGGADNVSGFHLSGTGELTPIAGSSRGLSATVTDPAQVEFSVDGASFVVTEKATNRVDVFPVGHDGLLGTITSYASAGLTPFGFAFGKRGQLFVSEAFGGAPNASTVSSYQIADDGDLEVISPTVATTETAACWVAIPNNGRYLYTTNTGSSSLSGYAIRSNGTISLLDADGVTGETGMGSSPIDLAFSNNSQFLYALSAGTNTITAFRVGPHGQLANVGTTMGLPAGSNGLAAR